MSGIQRLADAVKASAQVLANETQRLVRAERRYELVRTLSPAEFKAIWQEALEGRVRFDDAIDREIEKRSKK